MSRSNEVPAFVKAQLVEAQKRFAVIQGQAEKTLKEWVAKGQELQATTAKRTKALGQSPLDEIGGIGARRKRALLNHFGSARAVARAGLGELERVAGISKTVAKKVYGHFHAND